ncbi:IS110 family transposase [Collimonas sp. OK412]|jgi:transposase|uniref:IS110 family transposase n=1 Tax=Collimonas sp. (strain OK412) TaxID=1801619 RepID=UPI0008F14826|nr:IS110 family transposase [Collimonas sp. OK412]SFC02227.1 transposase [Collimonas sp. OK412]
MEAHTIGIDLAKNLFQVHGVDRHGQLALCKKLRRSEMAAFFAKLPPALIGMEACGGAHHWARKLAAFGHQVRLMPAEFVKPYVKSNKSDMRDAEAICEAVARPTMRFVAVKSIEQQAILSLHRAREGAVKARTAQANQIRGLLTEYGMVLPQGIVHIEKMLPSMLADMHNALPGFLIQLFQILLDNFRHLDQLAQEIENAIRRWHLANEESRRLEQIPGVGPLTATALVATIGEAKTFHNGRQFAAWLGLVPRQHSSGGRERLLGISKRGDTYLRKLLIHGGRAVVRYADRHPSQYNGWLANLLARRHKNVVAVALANKNARIAWALLAKGRVFCPDPVLVEA